VKILQIAYYYPPMGGAGVQRALKFSKYLPLQGITPVVLAGLDPHYVQDASLLADVPRGLEVHRVPFSPWLARLAAQRRAKAATTVQPSGRDANTAGHPAWRDAALRTLRAFQVPDDLAGWSRVAALRARQILQAHASTGQPIDLIYSSSPPVSAHALAERLSQEFRLPWVADFRDLWTDNPAYHAPSWRRALDRRTEQRWLSRADGIVTVTPSWQALLGHWRPSGIPVAFIPNGYDEDDFAGLPPALGSGTLQSPENRFTLIHTGTFYGPRDPAGFLDGLARYLDGPRVGHPALRVRLLGNMGARFGQALHAFSVRYPDVIVCEPYVPHTQALAAMMAADALLLVVGGGRGPAVQGWLPGKIFEYLRSGKPVLSLGDAQGDAARLIAQHGRGCAVAEHDAAGVAQALSRLIEEHMATGAAGAGAGGSPAKSSAVFERRELARQLADHLRVCRDHHRKVHPR
jgi:glycosyltransferase involved in cell wall biosynthesis